MFGPHKQGVTSLILPWKLAIPIQLHMAKFQLHSYAAWTSLTQGIEEALMRFYLKHSWARALKENIQSKVQKTAHEIEAADLGREMKT